MRLSSVLLLSAAMSLLAAGCGKTETAEQAPAPAKRTASLPQESPSKEKAVRPQGADIAARPDRRREEKSPPPAATPSPRPLKGLHDEIGDCERLEALARAKAMIPGRMGLFFGRPFPDPETARAVIEKNGGRILDRFEEYGHYLVGVEPGREKEFCEAIRKEPGVELASLGQKAAVQ